jgi:hypothetical protein
LRCTCTARRSQQPNNRRLRTVTICSCPSMCPSAAKRSRIGRRFLASAGCRDGSASTRSRGTRRAAMLTITGPVCRTTSGAESPPRPVRGCRRARPTIAGISGA